MAVGQPGPAVSPFHHSAELPPRWAKVVPPTTEAAGNEKPRSAPHFDIVIVSPPVCCDLDTITDGRIFATTAGRHSLPLLAIGAACWSRAVLAMQNRQAAGLCPDCLEGPLLVRERSLGLSAGLSVGVSSIPPLYLQFGKPFLQRDFAEGFPRSLGRKWPSDRSVDYHLSGQHEALRRAQHITLRPSKRELDVSCQCVAWSVVGRC
jgi:hypothetical protein